MSETRVSETPLAHGGDLERARARFPNAPEPWLDLSTGINPQPYPLPPLATEVWSRLPQPSDLDALLAAAATRYGTADPAMIVAAPGSQALIQLLPHLLAPTNVAVLAPAYAEHRAAWAREGHAVADVNDPEETDATVVIAVNPNNPTGSLIDPADLARLAERLASRGGLLVVDEAFMDVIEPAASLVPLLPPSAIVLRSFGKTYGLAGLRLGFAVAEPTLAARIAARLGPWAVSGPALAIGRAALADTPWLAATRARLARDAIRLEQLLIAGGARIIGGTPLFRLLEIADTPQRVERLGRAGIHVRAFDDHPSWLRFGLPADEPAWQRLANALSD